ncbi:Hsp70 family protein [Dermatophilus congolensis]|uniref:Hsp70 family protein n=1 Tax=Dermatophilus congolensis TaxID=1863 RepID=UPI001AAEE16E|nr:Hsp70 family protein [Dermatophilus congolensis]MBO3142804.1 Hsp70 family protein [Dermatophilus congolensis]MBO3151797.1 Hsp70 family protein [Dermatophilus congolensis]MBO3161200.1 Hsp70 family protein [Dermatophilus congolensis]MBO3163079.1 Hsp70 family protein [Dermatophilus congolensis]MBO3176632.1 Hsp70 family protein [Dermatophilus congolensis]
MTLGIDFGTTRTIVAYADRGNYPVVSFFDADDEPHCHFPSVVADTSDGLVYGFAALEAAADGARLTRSFKRLLASPDVFAATPVCIGDREVPLIDVLTGYAQALREALATKSSIAADVSAGGPGMLDTVLAVPAHAHGPQRYLTLEAFRAAGFTATGMVNEPSAAGFEFTHGQSRTLNSRRSRVVVYDLGGGTFDASLVNADGTDHQVMDSTGLNTVGGDDFDAGLARCAMRAAGRTREELGAKVYAQLLEDCRDAKEHLSPQSKRIPLEVDGAAVTVTVADFYEEVAPLVKKTIQAMAPLVGGLDHEALTDSEVAGIYLVGGASGLPLVPRLVKAQFGRRVFRSPYPAASTAIGLAIAADEGAGYSLSDRLSRGFGVFREGDGGRQVSFDPLVDRSVLVDRHSDVSVSRTYRAAHNAGWFRFVEYGTLDEFGGPRGQIVPFAEVVFPFDAALQAMENESPGSVAAVPVERTEIGPLIEERYTIDRHGIVSVTLSDQDTGFSRTYELKGEKTATQV